MNDIDELIERLEKAKKSCGTIGVAALDEAITALQQMQKENKRLDAALGEIKEYFGRDFDRYQGLVEIYRKARAGE